MFCYLDFKDDSTKNIELFYDNLVKILKKNIALLNIVDGALEITCTLPNNNTLDCNIKKVQVLTDTGETEMKFRCFNNVTIKSSDGAVYHKLFDLNKDSDNYDIASEYIGNHFYFEPSQVNECANYIMSAIIFSHKSITNDILK